MNQGGFCCSVIGGEGGFCCSVIGGEGGFCCSISGGEGGFCCSVSGEYRNLVPKPAPTVLCQMSPPFVSASDGKLGTLYHWKNDTPVVNLKVIIEDVVTPQ